MIEGACAAAWKALRNPETGQHYEAPHGQLVVSLDPAGDSGTGDDSVLMVRRGLDVLELYARQRPEHLTRTSPRSSALLARHRNAGDGVVPVVMDAAGDVGARVRGAFICVSAGESRFVEIVCAASIIQTGKKAERDPLGTCRFATRWRGRVPDVVAGWRMRYRTIRS